jgi:hypothetical protein
LVDSPPQQPIVRGDMVHYLPMNALF